MNNGAIGGVMAVGGTLGFNIAFTKTTKEEAKRELERQVFAHREQARVGSHESGIDDKLVETMKKEIDDFDQQGHTINVELNGPDPLRFKISKGPR